MKKTASLFFIAALFSCAKKDAVDPKTPSAYQLRIAAVENSGATFYTPVSRVKSGKVAVAFETDDVADIKEYKVEVSSDGVVFKSIQTIAADLKTPNRLYRDTVMLP